MKHLKLYIGLGVLALLLAACEPDTAPLHDQGKSEGAGAFSFGTPMPAGTATRLAREYTTPNRDTQAEREQALAPLAAKIDACGGLDVLLEGLAAFHKERGGKETVFADDIPGEGFRISFADTEDRSSLPDRTLAVDIWVGPRDFVVGAPLALSAGAGGWYSFADECEIIPK